MAFQPHLSSNHSFIRKGGITPDPTDLKAPFYNSSLYKRDFLNWGPTTKVVEKRPEYPRYSLHFQGQSTQKRAQPFKKKKRKDRYEDRNTTTPMNISSKDLFK